MITPLTLPNLSLEAFFTGPPLTESTPTLIYFAISAKDSLQTPPFSNFISFLPKERLRILSFTLPYHADIGTTEKGQATSPEKALAVWAKQFEAGNDVLASFLEEVNEVLHHLIQMGAICEGKLFASGLSRGAFLASLLAAKNPAISHVLGFAPLVDLAFAKEFAPLKGHPIMEPYHLKHSVDQLYNRHIRFYIGNHDERVETRESFEFIYACSKKAHSHRIRSAPLELTVYPSIGHKGHGTPDEIFLSGAKWIETFL